LALAALLFRQFPPTMLAMRDSDGAANPRVRWHGPILPPSSIRLSPHVCGRRLARVTPLASSDQVPHVVGAPLTQRHDVVHLHRAGPALTSRLRREHRRPDGLPVGRVGMPRYLPRWRPVVLPLVAGAQSASRQLGTARRSAGSQQSVTHRPTRKRPLIWGALFPGRVRPILTTYTIGRRLSTIKRRIVHTLTAPALPRHAVPGRTPPRPPYHATPGLALPCQAKPRPACLALPRRARPGPAAPRHASPRRARPCLPCLTRQ
jgi:hypothetical protein